MTDYIEVDFFVMGVYQGKRKIGKNSICGALLSGDFLGAEKQTAAMVDELNRVPGVKASSSVTKPAARAAQSDRADARKG